MRRDRVKRLSILVVEDDALIGRLLCDMLETMGHYVCANENSQASAVWSAANRRPGLMIVDAGMKFGAGMATVAEVLSHGEVPYLFTTCDRRRLRASQPDAVILQKPFNEAELARAIKLALSAPTIASTPH